MPEKQLPADFHDLVEGKNKRLCCVRYCRNPRRPKNRLCSKHIMERWRAANPIKSGYHTLKDHATRRRLEFSITLEEYTLLVTETGYVDGKGNEAHCLHLDRVDACKGYSLDNLQVLTCSENSAKSNTERRMRSHKAAMLRRKGLTDEQIEAILGPEDDWCDPDDLPPASAPADGDPF